MDTSNCRLCPRNCAAARKCGQKGFCGAGGKIAIGRYGLHQWEEPCLSGTHGSGTVFFSYCTLRCIYCQNYTISTKNHGRIISTDELSDIFLQLQKQGAHNINLVTPTHYADKIISAIDKARRAGLRLPIVYNTSGYESIETLKMLEGYIDIYLPDFKYWRGEYAKKYSAAADYPQIAKEAVAEMVRQIPKARYSSDGIMQKGVIVRHMLLPGLLYDAKKIVDYLYSNYKDDIVISLMSQYTPMPQTKDMPPLNRRCGDAEYEALCSYAARIGITNAYIQEGSAASESFIPDFYDDKI